MSNIIKELLQRFSIFKTLSDEELQPILNIALKRKFPPKVHVFMQGEPLDRVFFISSGKVKIYKTDVNGREQIVSILKGGEMFPHVGFFRGGDFPAHAEIIEETTLVIVPIPHFENILVEHPEVCIKLFRVMGEKIIDLQNRLEEQILNNANEQIIRLLLRLSKTYGEENSDGEFKLTTQFTNRELANMIGTSRETVSRTLNKLKKNNCIDHDKNGYFILKTASLEKELLG